MPVGAASSQAHAPEARDSRGSGCRCSSLPALPRPSPPPNQLLPAASLRGDSREHAEPGEGSRPRGGLRFPPALPHTSQGPSDVQEPPQPAADRASPQRRLPLPPPAAGLKATTPDRTGTRRERRGGHPQRRCRPLPSPPPPLRTDSSRPPSPPPTGYNRVGGGDPPPRRGGPKGAPAPSPSPQRRGEGRGPARRYLSSRRARRSPPTTAPPPAPPRPLPPRLARSRLAAPRRAAPPPHGAGDLRQVAVACRRHGLARDGVGRRRQQ